MDAKEAGSVASSRDILDPLLTKSPNLDEGEPKREEETTSSPSLQPYYPDSGYVYQPRQCRDVAYTVIFAIFVLASISFGIFSIVNHNSDYGLADSALYNSSSGLCYTSYNYQRIPFKGDEFGHKSSVERVTVDDAKTLGKQRLLDLLKLGSIQIFSQKRLQQSTSSGAFIRALVWTLVVTLVLSVPFIFGLLWLLKEFAKQVVYICLPLFILIPIALNIFWFVACTVSSECQEAFTLFGRIAAFAFIFLLCGIFVWIIVSNWYRVELTIRIMQTSAEALLKNWRLLLILPSLTFVLLIYIIPFVVFLIYAIMNGELVAGSDSYCEGDAATDCCTWKVDGWVPAYYVLAIFTVLWSALVMAEAQVYTISGTIAQWYFAATGSRVTGSIRHSLRNAFGPSFGTVCFSGLVLSFVRMIRAAVDSSQNEAAQQGCFVVILRCCVKFVLFAIEFLNKFAINFAAITGENYCTSARLSYDLLKRNLLSPIFVEAISTRILVGISIVLSLVYAIVVCAILISATNLGGDAYYVTALAWLFLLVLLILFTQVLDNVIDTVYICYAIDKDSGSVSKPEVHAVYLMLPLSRDQPPTLAIPQP